MAEEEQSSRPSFLLKFIEKEKEKDLPALLEFAGQIASLLSYLQVIDTPQSHMARRTSAYTKTVSSAINSRRIDDLQRNALGRKRRHDENS